MAKRQTDSILNTIMSRIENGQLLPGDEIQEKELIESCQVSRTPVREALVKLESEGLVVRQPRKGMTLFRPNTEQFLSILEVHATLEAQAAELAAKRISAAHSKRLIACTKTCEDFAENAETGQETEYYNLNRLYHLAIADAACNPYLTQLIKLNALKIMAHYRLRYRTSEVIKTSAKEHRRITDRILARDSEGARNAMLGHFNYTRDTVMHMIASVS